ncbi:hypothetical protein OIU77_008167 [Salix suchowensis]|uniref:Uncharacterized protein n=1 Tax=Salix suchowensis TaxID=1278906 RepID=A0ABQ9AJV8_9ROSI|nr:hypothetical protein OIU77_008167 [Salix suchowensis]
MLLRDRFVIDSAQDDKNLVLSYGPCQDHCEEFAAFGDTWSVDYSMNEEYGT